MAEEKTQRINIRLSLDEHIEVREAAQAAGLTLSEYGRQRILGRSVGSRTDAEAIRELRRVGGLLKHVAIETGGARLDMLDETLDELRDAIRRLGS